MPIDHIISGASIPVPAASRSVARAIGLGLAMRCPDCGIGVLYRSYLKVNDRCRQCGAELHHHQADDAPPYFVILIVGHVVVGAALVLEVAVSPPLWLQMALWPALAVALCLLLLPPVKGALIALQWALRMHGFAAAMRKTGTPAIDIDPLHVTNGA